MKRSRRRASLAIALALAAAAALGAGGCGKKSAETVVARVGKGVVTAEQMEARFKSIPPEAAAAYEGDEGRKRFLDGFIEEETWYQAALAAGIQKDEEVQRQVWDATRRILIQSYFQRELQPYTVLTEEDVRKIYDENIPDWTKPKEMKVRGILLPTPEEAEQVRRKLLAGADMEALAKQVSTDDYTKNDGGAMGYVVEHASMIPYVGTAPEMTAAIASLPLMEISKVLTTPRGYYVIRVEEVVPEAPMPFDKVKEVIRRLEQPKYEVKVRAERLEQLKKTLGVSIVAAGLQKTEMERADEAERIFREAQESKDWQARLDLYAEFLKKFPDNAHNHEAQFMIGFIYAEELQDFAKAQDAFNKLVRDYPQSPLVKDAQFMLANLGAEEPPPADAESGPASGDTAK